MVKTLQILLKQNPNILFVQNPSIFLSVFACFLQTFFKYKLVIDTHNAGLLPENSLLRRLSLVYSFLQKQAAVTVVTNNFLADLVMDNGGVPVVLPDKIPCVPQVNLKSLATRWNIAFICTFGEDEPVESVIESAALLPREVTIYVTGRLRNRGQKLRYHAPENVIFTDYLEDKAYWELLVSVDLVLDLTNRSNCLVCGAYEAVAVGTPMVLSRFDVLESYFYKGALFTQNTPLEIACTIQKAIGCLTVLKKEISELKMELDMKWKSHFDKLIDCVNG